MVYPQSYEMAEEAPSPTRTWPSSPSPDHHPPRSPHQRRTQSRRSLAGSSQTPPPNERGDQVVARETGLGLAMRQRQSAHGADVIRPSPGWLRDFVVSPSLARRNLAVEVARTRDAATFAELDR